jgi:hypothetical protein
MLRGATIAIAAILTLGTAGQVTAEPTAEQQAAIKANCRSDFMANCMGVPRGGKEAFQCLEKNLASLSAGCQQAIKAITAAAKPPAPAAPPPAAAPAPAPAPAAAPAPATPPPPASATAPSAPPPAAPAAPAPAKAAAPAPAAPAAPAPAKKAVTAPTPAPAAPPPPAAASAPAPAQVIVVPPRKIFALVRTTCRADYRAHCSDVDIGGGRVVQCLQANAASLSPACRDGLAALGR